MVSVIVYISRIRFDFIMVRKQIDVSVKLSLPIEICVFGRNLCSLNNLYIFWMRYLLHDWLLTYTTVFNLNTFCFYKHWLFYCIIKLSDCILKTYTNECNLYIIQINQLFFSQGSRVWSLIMQTPTMVSSNKYITLQRK